MWYPPGKSFKLVRDTISHFLSQLVIIIKMSVDVESGVREKVHRPKLGEVGQRRVQRFPWLILLHNSAVI